MENLIDCYTVMKFAGEEIDKIHLGWDAAQNQPNYWDLNNLWWNAASIYVPEMRRLNNLSGQSH